MARLRGDAEAAAVRRERLDEQVDLEASYAQLARAQRRHPLPKMPLVVISHGIPDPPMGREFVPGLNTAIETEWQQQQIKLATLVPGGRRIVATESGHMIPAEQPGLVVGVIEDMLQQIGTRSPRPEANVRDAADAPVAAGPSGEGGFAQRLDEDRWLAAFEVPGVAVALVRDGH